MATLNEFAARGKIIGRKGDEIVFAPVNTNYRLHLRSAGAPPSTDGQIISAMVRVKAVKVYTVPSGGGFISPLFGSPRTVQGRVLHVEEGIAVLRAGLPVIVELPTSPDAIALEEGAIAVGALVNVLSHPDARIEVLAERAQAAT